MILAPLLAFIGRVWRCAVLLKIERLVFQVFFGLLKCRSQNRVKVRICVYFCILRNKDEGDFRVLDMAAHTMTKEGFWRMKTFLVESETSAKDFARTRSFCWLQIASTVNNFSSEKMISSVSVQLSPA